MNNLIKRLTENKWMAIDDIPDEDLKKVAYDIDEFHSNSDSETYGGVIWPEHCFEFARVTNNTASWVDAVKLGNLLKAENSVIFSAEFMKAYSR